MSRKVNALAEVLEATGFPARLARVELGAILYGRFESKGRSRSLSSPRSFAVDDANRRDSNLHC